MPSELRESLNQAICNEIDAALDRIAHCVGQLTDEQVWQRPPNSLNAVANLLLHLSGNVKQMLADNLTGTPDTRDRPTEFSSRAGTPKAELLHHLTDIVQQAKAAFRSASDERLTRDTRVNTFDLSGLEATVRCVAHFRGHTQEIIHMTRAMLGDKYQFAGAR